MRNIYRITLSLILVFTLGASAYTQGVKIGLPEIEYYSRSQYGGDRQNWRITQGETDLLFFANNDGLLSFDGNDWKLYSQSESYSCARSVKRIGHKIYVGSYNELGYFEYDSRQQLIYKSLAVKAELKTYGDYWDIAAVGNTVVFYSENAICIFEEDKLDAIIPANTQFMGLYTVNGRFYVQDVTKGLLELRNRQLYPITGGEIFIKKDIGAIIPLSQGQYIIGTLKDGLFKWDSNGIKAWDVSSTSLLKKANILCGTNYQNENLVFGTINMGLIIINKNGDIVAQIGKDKGLQNNTVDYIFIDKEENLWCGLDNGIAKVNYNSTISFLHSYYDIGTGFALEHFKDSYYLATIQGVYRCSEDKFNSQLKERSDFTKIAGTEGQCWSLYKDEETLLCGHTFGVFAIQGNESKLITPPTVTGVWAFRKIANNPNLLLAGTYTGLILLEKTNGQWHFKTIIEGFNESARLLEWEDTNTLLVSHSNKGVYKLSFNSDFTKIVDTKTIGFMEFSNTLQPVAVTAIQGKCLFTNSFGIYSLNETTNKPERDTRFNHFFQEKQFPSTLKEDQFGNVWYFYINKIGVLRKLEDGTYKNVYYPFEPIKNKLVNYFQSCFIFDKNNTFFNTEDGFAHYYTSDSKDFQKPFNVHITSFKSRTDSINHSFYESNNEAIEQQEVPQFAYQDNSFDVQFSATFFEDKNIQYSTYLKNIDITPSYWTTESDRSFTDLKEGKYELTIQAKNKYQVLSKPLTFKFIVNPPWYRSLVAKISYLILLGVFLYFATIAFKRYVKSIQDKVNLENEKQFLAKEERLKNESLIQEKEVIRLRNESLSSEMSFKEKELANLTVHIVQKNDFLSEIKEQLRRVMVIKETAEYVRKINNLIKKIDQDIENENNWSGFERQFDQVHATFLNHLTERHPSLNTREQKLCAYIKMGMASKEIASLMNISTRAVENNRYKLRQSLELNPSANLADYIMSL